MEAYAKFDIEMQNLEGLHAATLFAYDQAVERTKERIQQKYIKASEPIQRTLSKDYTYTLASNARDLKAKYRIQFRENLRETLFVRAISILEVFLIDTLREIFVARTDLFHREEHESFSYARLLSFRSLSEIATHLINKECRKLQNRGFNYLSTYFASQLEIEFDKFTIPMATLREYHDRRHLLVHRLGRSDAKYRRDYKTEAQRLTVGKRYLLDAFETIRLFADFVHGEANFLIEQTSDLPAESPLLRRAVVVLLPLGPQGKAALQPQYTFTYGDHVVRLSDILSNKTCAPNGEQSLEIRGSGEQIRAYIDRLRALEDDDHIQVSDVKMSSGGGKKKSKPIPKGILQQIQKTLPPKPWPVGVHKEIASKLGLSNTQVYRALWELKQAERAEAETI